MSHRPFPDRNRALHQLWRHRPNRAATAGITVSLETDVSPFLAAIQQVQADMMFGWHPDLQEADGTLDNLYPEMNE
ncbi:hypothetical protein KV557_09990 [Kitasatospora aureofaciens]|uniref:hypothetical protein n=1 Tax=Kitasatospora aureofaciens TaxID=1894 RepID=UPI001C486632|nr:hypothetical protein [Kitasatospora aureofaciens]MBV6697454.1 hypothetical protein [Kitasatospora aureofaciens]